MSYQSDSVRKMQLLSLLAQKGHPFGKFLWGEFNLHFVNLLIIEYEIIWNNQNLLIKK